MVGNIAQGKLEDGTQFRTLLPQEVRGNFYEYYLKDLVDSKKISYSGEDEPGRPWYIEMLPTFFNVICFCNILVCFYATISRRRRRQGYVLR